MSLTLKEYDPVEAKKEMDLEIKKEENNIQSP